MARVRFMVLGTGLLLGLSSASVVNAQTTCYVDSVAGDDTKSGLSEAEATQSRNKIASTCTTVKFKRGSVFEVPAGEQIITMGYTSKIKTLTNYGDPSLPLPKFWKTRSPNNGGMIQAYQGGMTIDGLSLSGSQSDAQMKNLGQGIAIMAGSNTKILNNEIFDCDIGMMLTGTGSLVQNNYVHDLHVSVDAAPGVDPNVVGGAEGIFVNGSNNEVAYNTFINCSNYAEWTGGSCDGGATEVSVGADGAEVTGVKIHHNFGYNNCGFFEIASVFSSDPDNPVRGKFTNSDFYNNVSIDSGWLHLLQVANTDMHNIRWYNNTVVQHKGSTNAGILMVVYTAVASGMSGGQLYEDSIYWTNNLFVADGVNFMNPDSRVIQTTNLIIKDASKQDPGFINLKGTTAADYDLLPTSPAVNAGTVLPSITVDFLNRAVPDPSGQADIGAFEVGSTAVTPPPTTGGTTGSTGTGGASGSGGATTTVTGQGGTSGSTRSGTGGATGSGGATATPPTGAGGMRGGSGSGGATGAGGSSEVTSVSPGTGGSTTATTATQSGSSGCSCRVGQTTSASGIWHGAGGWALLLLAMRRVRRRR
jgi:MYXO-CTERM domain-containing protein